MKLTRKGYPNTGEVTGWIPDRRGNLRPVHVVTDEFGRTVIFDLGKPINRLPPNQTFVRDVPVREFGRKGIREALARKAKWKALRKIGANLHPALKAADAAYDAWEFYNEVISQGEPLPRDPLVEQDVELDLPANWRRTDQTAWAEVGKPYYNNAGQVPEFIGPASRVTKGWSHGYATDFPTGKVETSFDDIVYGTYPTYTTWKPFAESATDFPPGWGTQETVEQTAAGPRPAYANPPRLGPPVTRVRPMPSPGVQPEPEPFRRANEAPNPWLFDDQDVRVEPTQDPVRVGVVPRPFVPPTIIVNPVPMPKPGENPGLGDSPSLDPRPGEAVQPSPLEVLPPRRDVDREPPGEHVKERKARIRAGKILLGIKAGVGVTTEMLDIINAAWNALPDHCKPGYYKLHYRDKATGELKTYYKRRWRANFNQRHAAVWRCADEMDVGKFLKNLVKANASDRAWAKLGQVGGAAGKAAGRDTGWQFGPWDTLATEWSEEAQQAERIARERRKRDQDYADKKFSQWVVLGS